MPHIRPVAHGSRLPLYDVAATRRIETEALAGRPNDALIRQAGLSVAQLAMAIAPHGTRVWVACGPGNNGADGLEAARHLQAWGKQVFVTTLVHGQPDDQATGRRLQQAVDAEKREKAEVVAELQASAQRNAELLARVEVRAPRAPSHAGVTCRFPCVCVGWPCGCSLTAA